MSNNSDSEKFKRPPEVPPAPFARLDPSLMASKSSPSAVERDTQRTMERTPAREYYRSQSVRQRPGLEPHEKYFIHPSEIPDGCVSVWVPIRVNGLDSGQLRQYIENGWVPARACDFPQHSGWGTEYPEAIMRGGYAKNIQADDVVEKDGQMLFIRSSELGDRAEQQRLQDAREQVDLQMQRLQLASRLPRGAGKGNTEVKYGRQYVNPDSFEGVRGEV